MHWYYVKCPAQHEGLPEAVDGGVFGSSFIEINETQHVVGLHRRHDLGVDRCRFRMEAIRTRGSVRMAPVTGCNKPDATRLSSTRFGHNTPEIDEGFSR